MSAKAASGDSSHLVDTRKSKYTPEANIYCGAETETSSFLLPFWTLAIGGRVIDMTVLVFDFGYSKVERCEMTVLWDIDKAKGRKAENQRIQRSSHLWGIIYGEMLLSNTTQAQIDQPEPVVCVLWIYMGGYVLTGWRDRHMASSHSFFNTAQSGAGGQTWSCPKAIWNIQRLRRDSGIWGDRYNRDHSNIQMYCTSFGHKCRGRCFENT